MLKKKQTADGRLQTVETKRTVQTGNFLLIIIMFQFRFGLLKVRLDILFTFCYAYRCQEARQGSRIYI